MTVEQRRLGSLGWVFWAALPMVCALGAGLAIWSAVREQPLDPDTMVYLDLAQHGALLGTFREPLWVAILAIAGRAFGWSSDMARLVGVAGFVGLIAA